MKADTSKMDDEIFVFLNEVANDTVEGLFSAEVRLLHQKMAQLIDDNNRLVRGPSRAILYKGHYFTRHGLLLSAQFNLSDFTALMPELEGRADRLLSETIALREDRATVHLMVARLVNDCSTKQDVRDALPDCLTEFSGLSHLPRTRPEAFTLTDPNLIRDFEAAKEKMLIYSVTHLIY